MTAEGMRSPRWNATTKLIIALTAVAVVGLVLWRFQILVAPLVTAGMVAYLLDPLITLLSGKLKWPRTAAAALIYLALVILLLASATGLGLYAAGQIANLNVNMLQIIEGLPERIDEVTHSNVVILGYTLDLSQFDFTPIYEQIVASVRPIISQAGAYVGGAVSGAAELFGWALFVLVISFYIVKDMPGLGSALDRYATDPGYQHDVATLTHEFKHIWNAFLRGQAILGITIGVIVWIGLTILGVRFAFGLALLSGIVEFLPIIGPIIAGAVAVGVALFQDTNWFNLSPLAYALLVTAFFLVIQQFENNFFAPRIMGEHLNLHPIIIMVGAIMGASLGGIIGVLLAAPMMATIKLLGGYAWRKMLDLPPFPPPGGKPPEKKSALSLPKFDVRAFFKRSKSGSTTNDKQQ
ncbi:MAG TPA: AI-2E family transporter [Anaerolineales bacterium]|nr:AI-2E family transporter [Anaerolineales bacterium]